MKINLENLIKYETNKRELFIRHYVEEMDKLNNGVFAQFRERITPYSEIIDKFNSASDIDREEMLKTKEMQEAMQVIADGEKLKNVVIQPEYDEQFFIDNLTISKEELKQYLYN